MEETPLSKNKISELLKKHCPVFRLSNHEQNFPCSVEFFIQSSELYKKQENKLSLVTLKDPCWSVETLVSYQKKNPNSKLILRPKKKSWKGQYDSDLNNIPVYGFGQHLPEKAVAYFLRKNIGRVVDLKYFILYTYNGSTFRVPPFRPIWVHGGIGSHLGDIEHVMVRVDADNGHVLEVYFSCHSTGEGKFCASKYLIDLATEQDPSTLSHLIKRDRYQLDFYDEFMNHPIIYVASGSHANYPKGLSWKRFSISRYLPGFGDDICSNDGRCWQPKVIEVDKKKNSFPAWIQYNGNFGDVRNFRFQTWWNVQSEHPRQVSPFPVNMYHSIVEEGLESGRCTFLGNNRLSLFDRRFRNVANILRFGVSSSGIDSSSGNRCPIIDINIYSDPISRVRMQRRDISCDNDDVWISRWAFIRYISKGGVGHTCRNGWGYALLKTWAEQGHLGLQSEDKNFLMMGTHWRRRCWIRFSGNVQTANFIKSVSEILKIDPFVVAYATVVIIESGDSITMMRLNEICHKKIGPLIKKSLLSVCSTCVQIE